MKISLMILSLSFDWWSLSEIFSLIGLGGSEHYLWTRQGSYSSDSCPAIILAICHLIWPLSFCITFSVANLEEGRQSNMNFTKSHQESYYS